MSASIIARVKLPSSLTEELAGVIRTLGAGATSKFNKSNYSPFTASTAKNLRVLESA